MKQMFLDTLVVYKKNFWKLFIPIVVLQLAIFLPMLIITLPGIFNTISAIVLSITGIAANVLTVLVLYALLMLLFVSPLVVANTVYIADKTYAGDTVTTRASWASSRKCYGRMLRSYLAATLGFVPIVVLGGLAAYAVGVRNTPGVVAGWEFLLVAVVVAALLLYVLGTVFVPYIVVSQGWCGFAALAASFRYLYRGRFLRTVGRLCGAALMVAAFWLLVNWLTKLPFRDLFMLYLKDPLLALRHQMMPAAIGLSVLAIFLVALVMPFWYAFSYRTYQVARCEYEEKTGVSKE